MQPLAREARRQYLSKGALPAALPQHAARRAPERPEGAAHPRARILELPALEVP